jgi:hypothetical protein
VRGWQSSLGATALEPPTLYGWFPELVPRTGFFADSETSHTRKRRRTAANTVDTRKASGGSELARKPVLVAESAKEPVLGETKMTENDTLKPRKRLERVELSVRSYRIALVIAGLLLAAAWAWSGSHALSPEL